MTVEDCEVADGYFWVDFQVLQALVGILHAVALADVADDARVEALDGELEGADAEGVVWLQNELFVLLESTVDAARLEAIRADIRDEQGAEHWVVDQLKVVLDDLLAANGHVLAIGCAHEVDQFLRRRTLEAAEHDPALRVVALDDFALRGARRVA